MLFLGYYRAVLVFMRIIIVLLKLHGSITPPSMISTIKFTLLMDIQETFMDVASLFVGIEWW